MSLRVVCFPCGTIILLLWVSQGRKKKFIDKKESSTFHVVHRSQQDKAQEGEDGASEFVLIPSGVREGPVLYSTLLSTLITTESSRPW